MRKNLLLAIVAVFAVVVVVNIYLVASMLMLDDSLVANVADERSRILRLLLLVDTLAMIFSFVTFRVIKKLRT